MYQKEILPLEMHTPQCFATSPKTTGFQILIHLMSVTHVDPSQSNLATFYEHIALIISKYMRCLSYFLPSILK